MDNKRVTEDHPDINKDQADYLLRRDVRKSEVAVLRLIKVPLEDGQFNSLCSFVFNLGSGSLQSSTLRRKINRGIILVQQMNFQGGYGLEEEN